MEIKDFVKAEYADFECKNQIWGKESGMLVTCENSSLEEMLPLINKLVDFLENNKPELVKALLDDGMLELAEEWTESAEEADDSTEENPCYIFDDGTKVYLPISEEDFAASLRYGGMNVYYDEENSDISANVYIDCVPDYFAGHCIEIYMDSKGNIDVNGLAG